MKQTGSIGIGMMVTAFGLTILASLWLAAQARSQTLADLIPYALIAFVLVFMLMIAGLRLWLARPSELSGESDVVQQRRILEQLTPNIPTAFAALSQSMGADEAALESVLRELVRLRLFNGYIDWRGRWLCSMMPHDVMALDICLVCGAELERIGSPVTCTQCSTVYLYAQA
ncbi:MAG: hypothetical protein NZ750_01475 [Anaerolineae bacterium]|nr:hypothetical protein [Anaerolineae bacterium]MDW8173255.1 hypothetical protein [Anaerolineae bacterium]